MIMLTTKGRMTPARVLRLNRFFMAVNLSLRGLFLTNREEACGAVYHSAASKRGDVDIRGITDFF